MARGQSRGYNRQRRVGPAEAHRRQAARDRREFTGATGVRPDGSSYKMRRTRRTSTPGQRERLRVAAYNNNANRGADWIVHNPNAADVSMNNPPVYTDFDGHRINPKTGKRMHSRKGNK